jgi:hypothetical protein
MNRIAIAVLAVAAAFLSACGDEPRPERPNEVLERHIEFEPAVLVGKIAPSASVTVVRGRKPRE